MKQFPKSLLRSIIPCTLSPFLLLRFARNDGATASRFAGARGRRRIDVVFSFLLLFLFLFSLPQASLKKQRILYVGNSLTYFNNLPALVKEIAGQDGVEVSDSSFLYPDYSLEDHWNEGKVAAAIAAGKFDFVVVQQGPSALPESQSLLKEFAGRFATACNDAGSKLALYMVWPSEARSFDFDNVINSYKAAAAGTNSMLCPAGEAWKYAWQSDASLPLYSNDRFHPGLYGSVLAALTIYGSLYDKKNFDFLDQKQCSWGGSISTDKTNLLVKAALKAMGK